MAERPNPWRLTPREMQLCDLLVTEGGAKPAARRIPGISIKTVELHLQRARRKSGTRTMVLLAVAHDRIQRGAA